MVGYLYPLYPAMSDAVFLALAVPMAAAVVAPGLWEVELFPVMGEFWEAFVMELMLGGVWALVMVVTVLCVLISVVMALMGLSMVMGELVFVPIMTSRAEVLSSMSWGVLVVPTASALEGWRCRGWRRWGLDLPLVCWPWFGGSGP